MSKSTDPALYESNYERNENDRYWTHPWLVDALLQTVEVPTFVWEPAAGRGDMTRALQAWGCEVISSDIDLSEFDSGLGIAYEQNFVEADGIPCFTGNQPVKAIVTNPPYSVPRGIAYAFARKAIDFMRNTEIEFVAMLLRAEFNSGKSRADIFGSCPEYFGELVLTERPRWDWWFREKPEASPRHNFSWFLWQKNNPNQYPVQLFHYRKEKR